MQTRPALRALVGSLAVAALALTDGCGGGGSPGGSSDEESGAAGGAGGRGGAGKGGSGGAKAGGSSGSAGAKGGAGGGAAGGSNGGAPAQLDAGDEPEPDAGLTDGPAAAPDTKPTTPPTGLGAWTGKDNVPPSPNPPGGLPPSKVPMLVSLGFDDNPDGEGVRWVVSAFSALTNPPGTGNAATFDGTTVKATFYNTSTYTAAASSWKAAHAAGFETGNHTIHHYHGSSADGGMNFDVAGWTREIQGCNDFLASAAVGAPRAELWGFRTPFLQYNASTFTAVKALGFWYDCSIEEGHQPEQDGTNYVWPYTLDSGSPGNATHPNLTPIKTWPTGLWEMPAYRVIIPPDAEAAKYGIPAGLRAKLMQRNPMRVGIGAGKITGLDYNLWYDFKVTKAEFVAIAEHTLDLRLKGNRAPMLLGMHSAIYASADAEPVAQAAVADRRAAIVEFLKYALKYPEVRIVTTKAVLDWIRNPVPLP